MAHGVKTVTLALVALVAACGGSSHSAGVKVPSVNGHPDPAAVASSFGCSNYTPSTDGVTMFAASSGSCDMGSESVSIDTFANRDAESKYQRIADGVGKAGNLVYGDRWAVQTDGADLAAQIQAKVGGDRH